MFLICFVADTFNIVVGKHIHCINYKTLFELVLLECVLCDVYMLLFFLLDN